MYVGIACLLGAIGNPIVGCFEPLEFGFRVRSGMSWPDSEPRVDTSSVRQEVVEEWLSYPRAPRN